MRALAIDLGDKRTGLAIGDTVTGIATPIGAVHCPLKHVRSGPKHEPRFSFDAVGLEEALVGAIREHEPDVVVLGLPLNMDGSAGPRAELVRAWAVYLEEAAGRAGLRPRFVEADERRSTERANELLARSGLTHRQKKQRRDSIAAAAFLADWLEGEGG